MAGEVVRRRERSRTCNRGRGAEIRFGVKWLIFGERV